jgi:hypothetical protein
MAFPYVIRKRTVIFNPLLFCLWPIGLALCMGMSILRGGVAHAEEHRAEGDVLPKEVPEEVLQVQMVLEANSSLTGQAVSVETYAQEQQRLQVSASQVSPRLAPSLYRSVELLRLLKVLKGVLPFL